MYEDAQTKMRKALGAVIMSRTNTYRALVIHVNNRRADSHLIVPFPVTSRSYILETLSESLVLCEKDTTTTFLEL